MTSDPTYIIMRKEWSRNEHILFTRESNPECQVHLDKHVVKMPIEYAQLLSTAHRLLDGTMWIDRTANNRRIKR